MSRLPVLLYHHVGATLPGTYPSLTIAPNQFERQVTWLARRGFTGVSSSDVVAWLGEGDPLPPRPLLLTFDDGYASLDEFAFPVLRRHGFTAIVFLVTGQIGGTNAWDERRGSVSHRLLSAAQIRSWARAGIEFGAHSRSHVDLTHHETDLAAEVAGSAADLEQLLEHRGTSFSYPGGWVDEAAREQVARCFDLAFGVGRGLNSEGSDPFLLRRTMVQPGDRLLDIVSRVKLGHSPLDPVRERVRFRTRLRSARRRLDNARQRASR